MTDRLEVKAQLAVSDEGEITGTAWPFGTPDRVGDVIEKGAFGAPVTLPMLFAHDQGQVVGVWDQIGETEAGLTVKGRLLVEDVARAREVRAMIRAGAVTGLSIGFVTKSAKRHAKGRTISALDLHEISIVAVPAHPGAQITSIKSVTSKDTPIMENEDLTHEVKTTPTNAPGIDTKAFEAVLNRLDKLEAKGSRLGAPAVFLGETEQKAFSDFLRVGTDRLSDLERKSLNVANDADLLP
ncbi:MAG: HK97 family phage prohead protease [Proteobacteria bacterium]|nr:HK97 family phage prohead protease [Pseudomonadota bacterium]